MCWLCERFESECSVGGRRVSTESACLLRHVDRKVDRSLRAQVIRLCTALLGALYYTVQDRALFALVTLSDAQSGVLRYWLELVGVDSSDNSSW
jgi:hypothetical protein